MSKGLLNRKKKRPAGHWIESLAPAFSDLLAQAAPAPTQAEKREEKERSPAFLHLDLLLPKEQDTTPAEVLGVQGVLVRRLGLLRAIAAITIPREAGKPTVKVGSLDICNAIGADDFQKKACARNMLFVCTRLGFVDLESVSYNYALYSLSSKGIATLEEASKPLEQWGWGWSLAAWQGMDVKEKGQAKHGQ